MAEEQTWSNSRNTKEIESKITAEVEGSEKRIITLGWLSFSGFDGWIDDNCSSHQDREYMRKIKLGWADDIQFFIHWIWDIQCEILSRQFKIV